MREAQFLRQNADEWKQFEQLLREKKVDPDRLADLFVQVTDDLSYARTFYPKSPTTAYLNGLAADVHQAVYRNRKEDRRRFVTFWTRELPLVVRGAHRELLVSFVIFTLAFLVGVISSAGDATFVRLIMGDAYVNMTLENIEQGDPLAVYKQMRGLDMFAYITLNNIRVAFYAFAMGLFLSFGTGYVLLKNGIMVGAFLHLFHAQGLLWESLLVIYIHGMLELSAIVIAGAAGLVMGNSILFPGSYSRIASFTQGAKRGLKIIVGLVPIFIVAGFLEGFVTRHTEMPMALSLAIILGSLAFILWYFVIYPVRRAPRGGTRRAAVPGVALDT